MKKTLYTLLCIFAFQSITISCSTIHEEPENNGIDPTLVSVKLDFSFIEKVLNTQTHTKSLALNPLDSHDLRYIVEIYSADNTDAPLYRFIETSCQKVDGEVAFSLTLNAAAYKVLAWVDHVDRDTKNDLHYETNCLKSIRLCGPYTGNVHTKDAFFASANLDLRPYSGRFFTSIKKTLELKRPIASFAVIATDMAGYLKENGAPVNNVCMPAYTSVAYHPSIITEYNVMNGKANQFSDGEFYDGNITDHTNESCVLMYDYVLMNDETSNVEISFDIYNSDNEVISKVKNLKIPLKRNTRTMVYLNCLVPTDGDGGIGIDDDFDDEIVIIIPD